MRWPQVNGAFARFVSIGTISTEKLLFGGLILNTNVGKQGFYSFSPFFFLIYRKHYFRNRTYAEGPIQGFLYSIRFSRKLFELSFFVPCRRFQYRCEDARQGTKKERSKSFREKRMEYK